MNIFSKITADKIAKKQLEEARQMGLEHAAAAEHHAALARMYRERVMRLERMVNESEQQAAVWKSNTVVA